MTFARPFGLVVTLSAFYTKVAGSIPGRGLLGNVYSECKLTILVDYEITFTMEGGCSFTPQRNDTGTRKVFLDRGGFRKVSNLP